MTHAPPCTKLTRASRSGSIAVEFAFIAPILLLLAFGILCFGILFASYIGVQQLAAEAARASVAGTTTTERDQLARSFVANNVGTYGVLDSKKVTVNTSGDSNTFKVSVNYDLSASPIFTMSKILPLPSSQVTRSASVLLGGY